MNKRIHKIVAGVVLLLAASVGGFAQQQSQRIPDCQFGFTFTATGSSNNFDNRQTGCTGWHFVYENTGFSALSIQLQSAPDSGQQPGTYVIWADLASGTLPLTNTVGGAITGYKFQPWVSVKLNSVTGTGTIRGTVYGYRPFSNTDINTFGLVASAIPTPSSDPTVSLSPCLVNSGQGTTASTNATSCKASAGNMYGFRFINTSTTIAYVRLYNLATAPTCSSAIGYVETIPVPPAGAAGGAAGIVDSAPLPLGYTTGIGLCVTGGSTSTDNTNAPTGVFVTVKYK